MRNQDNVQWQEQDSRCWMENRDFQARKKTHCGLEIEFKTLAMKADTDKLHAIFLLKKNVQVDIIKTILGYPLITVPETLKE